MLLGTHNFEFGEFLLDTREKVLLRDGKLLPITPKAFELLFVLLENHGHLVEKDELMKSVWANSFVEEGNITFTIGLLRRLLDDDTKNPRFIETVPRRGYRFIADVRRVETAESDFGREDEQTKFNLSANSPSPFLPVSHSRNMPSTGAVVALADWRRETDENKTVEQIKQPARLESDRGNSKIQSKYLAKYRQPPFAFALVAFLIGAIALSYYFYGRINASSITDKKKSIAVLPLKPINSANREEDYEVGIADALILKLGSMKGFVVRPLSAIRKYVDIEQDAITAGKEQRVDYVLASNYQLSDGKIRVTWQLQNVATGQTEDTRTTETDAGNLFAMQDAIADEIVSKLLNRFGSTLNKSATKRGTNNEDAYRLYLQGMYLYDRRTRADAENALDKLERATQLDPSYAKAWAGKAHVHRSLGYFSINHSTHEEYRKSIDAINRALTLDENLSDAHSALCENKFFYEYDFEGAELECKRAIELDPNSFLAHEIYSRCLWTLNRFDEAIKEVEISIDLQPTSLFSQRNYGISLFYARRNSEAIQQFKRVSEVDPNFVANYAWFVPALLVQGNEAEAFDWFIKWQKLLKADQMTIQAYEKAYQEDGWQGVGRERLIHFDEAKVRSYFLEACLTAHTGNMDKTFEYLERSLHRREWGIPFLRIDPSLDSVRHDPRFEDLAKRVVAK